MTKTTETSEEWATVNDDRKAINVLTGMLDEWSPQDQGYRALAYAINALRNA